MSGNLRLAQDGRATRLRCGEFAVYDFTRPYELAYDSAVQLAVFGFPRDLLALPPDSAGDLTRFLSPPTGGRRAGRAVAPPGGPGPGDVSAGQRRPAVHGDDGPGLHGCRRACRPGRVAAGRVAGANPAVAHPRFHRAAPGRGRSCSRHCCCRASCLAALPAPAVRGSGHHGGRLDPPPAPGAVPPGPGRSG
jgi:hypothetical protein